MRSWVPTVAPVLFPQGRRPSLLRTKRDSCALVKALWTSLDPDQGRCHDQREREREMQRPSLLCDHVRCRFCWATRALKKKNEAKSQRATKPSGSGIPKRPDTTTKLKNISSNARLGSLQLPIWRLTPGSGVPGHGGSPTVPSVDIDRPSPPRSFGDGRCDPRGRGAMELCPMDSDGGREVSDFGVILLVWSNTMV